MMTRLKWKLVFVAVLLLLFVSLGGWWYFGYYTKTPDYAVQQIEKALERHDLKLYHAYVDMDSLLDNSYDSFMEGLMESEGALSLETKSTVGSFMQMWKAPIVSSFRDAVDQYVRTGTWDDEPEKAAQEPEGIGDSRQVIEKSGLLSTQLRNVDSVVLDEASGTATAKVRVFQQEANSEFVLEVILHQGDDGIWRVSEIANLREFISLLGKVRRAELDQYVDDSAAIMEKHDKIIRDAEFRMTGLLTTGSLGSQETRKMLKSLMEDTILQDWQARREELAALEVPNAAATLHHLRLRICDLHIAYAEGYAAWMTDKKAATIREADAKLKQAKTLEQEARFLTKRISRQSDI